jgi:hypothetical protein
VSLPEEVAKVLEVGKALKSMADAFRHVASVLEAVVNGVSVEELEEIRELVGEEPRQVDGRFTLYCEECGEAISWVTASGHRRFPSEYKNRRFCSLKCSAARKKARAAAQPVKAQAPAVAVAVEPAEPVAARTGALRASERHAMPVPLARESILVALEAASPTPLSRREIVEAVTGKVNDTDLTTVNMLLRGLVAEELVKVVRGSGSVPLYVASEKVAA